MREVATCDRDFFFNNTATTEIYTLSLHDALPISCPDWKSARCARPPGQAPPVPVRHRGPRPASYRTFVRRSEEHTSELQSANISYAVFCLKKKNLTVTLNHTCPFTSIPPPLVPSS